MMLMRSLPYALIVFLLAITGFTDVATAQVTVSFQNGTNGYNGAKDTKLIFDSPSTNYGTATNLETDGSPDKSVLLYWDLVSIPIGSTVQSVSISVEVSDRSSDNYELFQLLRPWVENEATWNQYATGQNWQTGGASGSGDRNSTVLGAMSTSSTGPLTISLNGAGVSAVQSWVNNPGSNHGFILANYDSASNGLDFASKEDGVVSNRPKLTVTYVPSGGGQPSLVIGDATVTEGDAGTVNASFAVTLSYASTETVTVNYATANGSANSGSDYVSKSGTLTFQPGQTNKSITVSVNGDIDIESTENFFVNLSNAVNATIADNQGVGTILDDDSPLAGEPITFSVSGDYPYGPSELSDLQDDMDKMDLYSPSEFYVHIGDIVGSSESCYEQRYIDVANAMKTLSVPAFIIIGDNEWTDCSNPNQAFQWWTENFSNFEDNYCRPPAVSRQQVRQENWAFVSKGVLFIGINNPNGDLGSSEKNQRLQDDADWVDFHFQDKADQVRAAVVFGHAGPSSSRALFFDQFEASSIAFDKPVFYIMGDDHNWKLDNPFSAPNMMRLTVEKGSAEDPPQITVTMDPNNPWEIVRNPWNNNPPVLNNEPCVVAGDDQTIAQSQTLNLNGVATDDGVPTNPGNLAINWSKLSGPGNVNFGNASSLNTTASFTTGGVYSLQLSAADGQLTTTDALTVNVEGTGESFVFIDDVSVAEGDGNTTNATFTVTLSSANQQDVRVDYMTQDGTATVGDNDYVGATSYVTIPAGQTSRPISIMVNGDQKEESDEVFFVNLTSATNATISDGQGEGTILDDDLAPPPPSLAIDDVSVDEADGVLTFTVSLSAVSGQNVQVDYTTTDGSAVAPGDYAGKSGTLVIPANSPSGTIDVTLVDDSVNESDETFTMDLSNPVGATLADNQGVGTIRNDDTGGGGGVPVTVSFQDGVNGYTGARDTKMVADSPTSNHGSDVKMELDGSPDLSVLMSWDLTSIPVGSTVESVDLSIHVTNSSGHTYEIYESLRPWVEGEATWNQYASGQNWQSGGADGASDRGTTELGAITAGKGYFSFPLNAAGVAVVQSWVNNPAANRGFVILDYTSATNGLDFTSRETSTASDRPKLTVSYLAPSPASMSKAGGPELSTENLHESLEAQLPEEVTLNPNYPNPFNEETRIDYALPDSAPIKMEIYNVTGQLVRLLIDENQQAGYKSTVWDGRDDAGRIVGSGVYFTRLTVGQQTFVRMMVFQK